MESESGLRIDGKFYPLPFDEVLANLTGKESLMLEDYLGGWAKLDFDNPDTRSTVVLVWLAKHHAGEPMTIDAIENMRGLVFGDAVEAVLPPAEAAGAADSGSSQETSASTGPPGSPVETSATA